ADRLQPLEQRRNLAATLVEMGAARLGDREGLARATRTRLGDQVHVLEHGERRVDHPRARRIGAFGQRLDGADEIVAVARLVGDQLQEDEAEFAAVEHPAAPAATMVAAPAAPITPVAPVAAAGAMSPAPAMAATSHREHRPWKFEPARPAAAAIHPETHYRSPVFKICLDISFYA